MLTGSGKQLHRLPWRGAVLVSCAMAFQPAGAQVTQPSDAGVMSFPNVRVMSTPALAAGGSAAAAGTSGLRAYRDALTGELTETPSQAQVEELQTLENRRLSLAKALAAPPQVVRLQNGAVRARLDESRFSHAVVRRGDGGALEAACVVGDADALGFLAGRPQPRHDHAHGEGQP